MPPPTPKLPFPSPTLYLPPRNHRRGVPMTPKLQLSKMSHPKGSPRAGISFQPDMCRRSVAAFSILLRRVDIRVTLGSFPPRFRVRFVPFFPSSVVFGTDGLSTNPIPGRGGLMAFYEFCESDSCHLRRSRLIRACASIGVRLKDHRRVGSHGNLGLAAEHESPLICTYVFLLIL
jgi:hypothetical protein